MDKKIKGKKTDIFSPFRSDSLRSFYITPGLFSWPEKELRDFDRLLANYENSALSFDAAQALQDRNELLVSYAISKAENSALTLKEAKEIRREFQHNHDFDFLKQKLKSGKKLNQNDCDRLEFLNIVRAFNRYNENSFSLADLTPQFILQLHAELTAGLDIFVDYLPAADFDVYRSGKWRNSDKIRVASFLPPLAKTVPESVTELIKFIKKDPSATNIAIFHGALYALHPFNNGNKRVCRLLEHIILRAAAYNAKNLYSPSYYYHQHRDRYYKKLLDAVIKHNLNHFVNFSTEALFFSIAGVIKTSLESQKNDFLAGSDLRLEEKKILRPLVKRRLAQFGRLWALNGRRPSKQTFSNYLETAVGAGVLKKKISGRNTYYRLNGAWPEEEILSAWLKKVGGRVEYVPEEFQVQI